MHYSLCLIQQKWDDTQVLEKYITNWGQFNIKMSSYQYKKSHSGDKIHCRSQMRNIFLFGRQLKRISKLIYFYIFFGMLNTFLHVCLQRISNHLTKSASSLDRDEVNMDLMLVSVNNNIFPLISTIILPKVLTLCYPVHIEKVAVIHLYIESRPRLYKQNKTERNHVLISWALLYIVIN